jgi:hypothetical protein
VHNFDELVAASPLYTVFTTRRPCPVPPEDIGDKKSRMRRVLQLVLTELNVIGIVLSTYGTVRTLHVSMLRTARGKNLVVHYQAPTMES